MSFRTRIQSFLSDDVPTPVNFQCIPNLRNGLIYVWSFAGNCPIASFVFNGATQVATTELSPTTTFPGCMAVDQVGNLYVPTGVSNYEAIAQFSPNLEYLQTFGTQSAFGNYPDGVPLPANMTCCAAGQANFLVTCGKEHSPGVGPKLAALVAGHNLGFAGATQDTTEGVDSSSCAAGSDGLNGAIYVVIGPDTIGTQQLDLFRYNFVSSAVTYDPGTWPTTNTEITIDSLGAILPTDIDATWTHIFQDGCIFDQADNKLMVKCSTDDSVTNQCYLVKIDPADLSIVWKVVMAHVPPCSLQMPMGQTLHGTYAFLSIGGISPHEHTCVVVNTLDGTTTSYQDGVDGITLDAQCFDEISGAIIAHVTFTEGADSPVPIGNTPSSFTGWAAIYVNGPYTAPFQQGFARTWGRWG